MAPGLARIVIAAVLLPCASPAAACRFTLADQSDYAARTGFYLALEATPVHRFGSCKLRNLTIALGVANGSKWRFIVANPRWLPDREYTARAAIAPKCFELYLDGRRLGHVASRFAGVQNRELTANSVPDWASGAADYLPVQVSLDGVSRGGASISKTFISAPRPAPLMLLAPASASLSEPFQYPPETSLTITARFRLHAAAPDPKAYAPYIDRYGQSIHASFPGKIRSDADLQAAAVEEQAKLGAWGTPTGFDAWGGLVNAGWRDSATGFFHVVQHNGIWWLISPAGNPCFYIGLNTGPLISGNNTPVTGREWEFAALPPRTAPYDSARSSGDWGNESISSVSFDTWNMIRKYGDAWRSIATGLTVERMKAWGFSGFGKWSSGAGGLPTLPVLQAAGVPLLRRHPDIFAAKVRELFRTSLRQQILPRVNDPAILGWSFGSEYAQIVTPDEITGILAMPGATLARRALIDHALTALYHNDGAALAAAWHMKRSSAIAAPPPGDVEALRQYYADRYYGFIYETIKSIDSNHLYFGSWIVPGWWVNETDWHIMAAHADVIGYDRYAAQFEDSRLDRLAKSTGKPIFLGEFSFPPTYDLLRGYGMYPTASSRDDADSGMQYRATLEAAAVNPWSIGASWFEYRDQPVSGRGAPGALRPEVVVGENYAFGLVDVADRPKYELVEQVRAANLAAAKRRLALTLRSNTSAAAAPQNAPN